ncbi:MAG: hypothetical protein JJ926_03970 [Roseitalea sp.]|nr:hypothetical protein [Roseitalea sp.]MBO6951014.1 hypothetical protein [Rhizobiaceae bacterium]MBO6590999.1 hypothetical protein [Roseitalea sp.]MBO6599743.1 hypothetical protein [Roseitalea sp.]MBO6611499.1 hypothetical protein [Roseitalea sp.]
MPKLDTTPIIPRATGIKVQLCDCGCKAVHLALCAPDGSVITYVSLAHEVAVRLGYDLIISHDGASGAASNGVGHA